MNDVTLSAALARILKGAIHDPLDNRVFSVSFEGGTMADALTALIRAHGGVVWDAGLLMHRDEDPSPSLFVSVRTFHAGDRRAGEGGLTMFAPLSRLVSER